MKALQRLERRNCGGETLQSSFFNLLRADFRGTERGNHIKTSQNRKRYLHLMARDKKKYALRTLLMGSLIIFEIPPTLSRFFVTVTGRSGTFLSIISISFPSRIVPLKVKCVILGEFEKKQ